MPEKNSCPKCQAPLGKVEETPNGKKLIRCSKGSWDPEARKTVGCQYIKWIAPEPETLDEKCPKCKSSLVMQTTRFGKKMKKCSKGGWDAKEKKATGCDYIEWITGTSQDLDESCPDCNEKLILYTTVKGKKMKKCSTSGWDAKLKKPTGCRYVQWLKPGEELLPPPPPPEK